MCVLAREVSFGSTGMFQILWVEGLENDLVFPFIGLSQCQNPFDMSCTDCNLISFTNCAKN